MNATENKGVWFQEISEKTTMIVDTNRNQIIKRTNGVAKEVYNYPSEPTTAMIGLMVIAMEISEAVSDALDNALLKINANRGVDFKSTNPLTDPEKMARFGVSIDYKPIS